MKNIFDILKEIGLEIPADKKADFEKDLAANYKTVAEVEQKNAKITDLEGQLTTAKNGLTAAQTKLKDYEGVDLKDLNAQLEKAKTDLAEAEKSYAAKVADMEFGHLLDGAISEAKGKNAKAIKALIDEETMKALRSSKNQAGDIKTALENVKKENEYLFGEENPGNPADGAGSSSMGGDKAYDPAILDFAKGAGIDLSGKDK